MKCDEARQRVVTDYLEQSNRNLSDSLQAHLISCHDCRLYREDLNDIYRAFQREDRSSLPSKILRELKPIFKIGNQNRSLRQFLPKIKWIWIGGGVGVVVVFSLALPVLRGFLTEATPNQFRQKGDGVGPESYAGGVMPQEVVKEKAEQSPLGMVVEQQEETFKSSFEKISEKLKKKIKGTSLTREITTGQEVNSQEDSDFLDEGALDKEQILNSEFSKNEAQAIQNEKSVEAITEAHSQTKPEESPQILDQVPPDQITAQIENGAEIEAQTEGDVVIPAIVPEKKQNLLDRNKNEPKKEAATLELKQTTNSTKKFAIEQGVVGMPMTGGALQQSDGHSQERVLELNGQKAASVPIVNSVQDHDSAADPCDLNQHTQASVESIEALKSMMAVLKAQEPLGSSAVLEGIEPQGLVAIGGTITAQVSESSRHLTGSSGLAEVSLDVMVQDLKEPLEHDPQSNASQDFQPTHGMVYEFQDHYFMNYCQALPQDLELRPPPF